MRKRIAAERYFSGEITRAPRLSLQSAREGDRRKDGCSNV